MRHLEEKELVYVSGGKLPGAIGLAIDIYAGAATITEAYEELTGFGERLGERLYRYNHPEWELQTVEEFDNWYWETHGGRPEPKF